MQSCRRSSRSIAIRILAFVVSATCSATAIAHAADELLYITEGNRLRILDVDSLDAPPTIIETLVERAADGGSGRDVNGTPCFFPDGSGRFITGEDTGQPGVTPGWGIFAPDGTQMGKLTPTFQVAGAEPHGCSFRPDGVLFTSSVGEQGLGASSGQLIMWFPPFEGYPGAPGEFPDADPISDNYCILADDLGTAASVLVLPDGSVLVAQSASSKVERFTGPFPSSPDAEGGCGDVSVGARGRISPKWDADEVNREVLIPASSSMGFFSGLALSGKQPQTLYAASNFRGKIAEYTLDGTLIRLILDNNQDLIDLPREHGTPQGIAVGEDGTLYYADLALDIPPGGFINDAGPTRDAGKVWRITFDAAGEPNPPEIIAQGGYNFPDGVAVVAKPLADWPTYGGSAARQSFAVDETIIGGDNAAELSERWRFPTDGVVTGSAVVGNVFVPGEGTIQVAYFQSWDRHIYAVRLIDGSLLWRVRAETHPGASFENAASGHIEMVNGRHLLFIGAGEIMHALDAASGAEVWRFTAGTGCRDEQGNPPGLCGFRGERNQIESSPYLADGKLFFGMDVNDVPLGKGGFYAVDASDGRLAWFFDLESGATCTPDPEDEIRNFDGYHTEEELGLPPGFLATRPGCDFPRSKNGCGNIWSSPAVDLERGLLFVASSNCDTAFDPDLGDLATMPPYDEAIFALDFDGEPQWAWRPRRASNEDLAFGAVANLFSIEVEVGGEPTQIDVVGVGNKDGSYYVLDRDGVNQLTGAAANDDPETHLPADLPYWSTNVVPGGDIGGIIATSSVDEAARRIYFSTAPGDGAINAPPAPSQQPTLHALDMDTGEIVWNNSNEVDSLPSFGPTFAVPGAAFFGSVPVAHLRIYQSDVAPIGPGIPGNAVPLGAPIDLDNTAIASAAIAVEGTLLIGEGVGTRGEGGSSPGDFSASIPSDMNAFCVPGTTGCAACNDGLDNDGDGAIDAGADDGCVSASDPSEVLGDLDYDADVDEDDRAVFFAAFGREPGELGFKSAADFDADGLVSHVDYQAWLQALDDFENPPEPGGGASAPIQMSCGLVGLECLAVLAGAGWLRRRRLAAASRPARRGAGMSLLLAAGLVVATGVATGFMASPAAAYTDLRLEVASTDIQVGEEFDVLVLADVDTAIVGFGFDLLFNTAVLDWVDTTVTDPWAQVQGRRENGVVGLTLDSGVGGDGLLLATLTFFAKAEGTGWYSLFIDDGDLTHGFPLEGTGFDDHPSNNSSAVFVTAPEPSAAVLIALGLMGLAARRRGARSG